MGFDLPVFISAGIQDALNPMQLAIAGIYAVMMLFLRRSSKLVLYIAAGVFMGVLVALGVVFDLGFLDLAAVAPGLLTKIGWIFMVLGAAFLFLGFLFLKEWRMLLSGPVRMFAPFIPTFRSGVLTGLALSLSLAAGLACLSSLWPVNYQVLVQGEMAFTPGRFFYSVGAFSIYEFFRNGAVLFVLLFFVLAGNKKNAEFLRRKRSLVSIIASAVCLAVGGSLCFLFFVAATKPWL